MKLTIAVLLLIQSSLAFAGREERELKDKTAEPAAKSIASTYKSACGCEPKMNVKWDLFKTKYQLNQISNISSEFTENAAKYCDSADSKKAMCAVKTIEIDVANDATVNFANGTLTLTTDGNSIPSWDGITKQVDK